MIIRPGYIHTYIHTKKERKKGTAYRLTALYIRVQSNSPGGTALLVKVSVVQYQHCHLLNEINATQTDHCLTVY